MTSQRLHQMQIVYSQITDRLLLRINTRDRQEFRFWLTRRFVKRLWPGLAQALARQVRPEATHSPLARAAMMDLMHQNAISQADFNTRFDQQIQTVPMGTEPILVAKARLTPMKSGVVMLTLQPETGQGVELALDPNLLHALCKLFQDALPQTDWDLKLQFGAATTDSDAESSSFTSETRKLH
ncbi:MAG: hypothetical protein HQL89_03235 [Magnetococcales bacterium]|nr:hypothetical protein [Magnetococcales bacterium]